jgi:hypothetical protein
VLVAAGLGRLPPFPACARARAPGSGAGLVFERISLEHRRERLHHRDAEVFLRQIDDDGALDLRSAKRIAYDAQILVEAIRRE